MAGEVRAGGGQANMKEENSFNHVYQIQQIRLQCCHLPWARYRCPDSRIRGKGEEGGRGFLSDLYPLSKTTVVDIEQGEGVRVMKKEGNLIFDIFL